ncbi:D-alanyl-D-alanine dipeptidase [Legionella taurinensis]|uniref:D-alanyl-D-alanine dipeptidase n=1 Tax=Legionella taurinensis TaxID=70611 RepID=A0A3A5LKC9_9GAMM|nr:M15 family metallopeptidase [Legionella taurinensis]MDX1837819.1 M15 family metallopeptidase [Legionella taurinensis]PUT39678.1 D-alanyl-D-alanine dipeptidase [Legionella taurinensis]PUT43371.1 D-alanyl-D-alanine dipeptidase [Legionella taurinensis]PUT45817.1 D-alanyl-D-alanine dipeptidase [Legionella taurinensis]PUT47729.1 D-alanyl-D-alanine dipeptidase [Legionella taurinensis]
MLVSSQPPMALIAAPEVLAIPIVENHDPLIDIKHSDELFIGPSPEIPNNTDYTKMRNDVYQRLLAAQQLLPANLRFCLYEGFRSLALQKKLFDARYAELQQLHPHWAREQLFNETTKLISPVLNLDGSPNIPPHTTGAAIDVYLVDKEGQPVDMGIHPKDWMSDTHVELSPTNSALVSPEAAHYRRVMSHALLLAGFVNYPTEYWHWSYGDRYWAFISGKPQACYGSVAE